MKTFTLSNGLAMPVTAFGVYQIPKDQTKEAVKQAIQSGYRSIDTAQAYFNEEAVGDAVKECGIPRKDLFLTTKVWIDHYGEEKTYESVLVSLQKLKTDYVDLLLLHQPFNDYYAAWRALERLYKEGKAKAIGVSNFRADRMVDLAKFSSLAPMVNQVEVHPFDQQKETLQWDQKYGVLTEAWAPFGEGRKGLFTNPTLTTIGEKYGKTPAQVILRWDYQRGIATVAKSVHAERMVQNLSIFDFALSDEDMAKIASMDEATSSFFDHRDPATIEFFANLIQGHRKPK